MLVEKIAGLILVPGWNDLDLLAGLLRNTLLKVKHWRWLKFLA
jgi:hypothetical protein